MYKYFLEQPTSNYCEFVKAKVIIQKLRSLIKSNHFDTEMVCLSYSICHYLHSKLIHIILNFQIGFHVAETGVGPYDSRDKGNINNKAYYQWVPFMLFLQGCMFYIPHLIFKNFEDGKIKKYIDGLQGIIHILRKHLQVVKVGQKNFASFQYRQILI